VQTQDGPFPIKGYFASICIRESAFLGKNACRPTTWLRIPRRSRKDAPSSDWPRQRIEATHFNSFLLPELTTEWRQLSNLSEEVGKSRDLRKMW
jgi:hypothetical protein